MWLYLAEVDVLLCLPTEKHDMFTLEACAKMAESLQRVLAGFVDFVMVSWVIHLFYTCPTPTLPVLFLYLIELLSLHPMLIRVVLVLVL